MSAAIAIRPTSNPVHASSIRAIEVTGLNAAADLHDIEAGDANFSPVPESVVNEVSATPEVYYLKITGMTVTKTMKSPTFTPNSDGEWTWDNVVFPEAGSMTVTLMKVGTPDTSVQTHSVTVS